MQQVTATEAKNRFGYYCAQAKSEPVVVEKDGRPDTVLIDYRDYQAFEAWRRGEGRKSLAQRRREFNETYKDWIAEQNAFFEQHGIPGESLRPW